jgi:hypothetical protein
MADDSTRVPPADAGDASVPIPALPPDNTGEEGTAGRTSWWRRSVLAILVTVSLLAAAVGVLLGCKSGTLNLRGCGAQEPAVARATAAYETSGTVQTPLTTAGRAEQPTATLAPAALAADRSCPLRPFAQTDLRWANDVMRTGNSRIRTWGNALTATAMIYSYFGVDTDPGRLNACAGDQADLLYWEPVRARCAADKIPMPVRWSADATWADLERALAAGHPVIVGLQGGPAGSHFVVVTSGAGDQPGNYRIVDPWDGATYKTLADYINPSKGYVLKWLIVHEGGTPRPCAAARFPPISEGVTRAGPQRSSVKGA